MNPYDFDGHKLHLHPQRVTEYLREGDCYPIYLEISPVGSCNQRCVFCAYDNIGYPNRKLETARTLRLLDELAECGLKSILFAGEGEPLLHPDILRFVRHAQANGIDVGMFTNGQRLTPAVAAELLPYLTFLRFSFNAGTAESYAAVHRVKGQIFQSVVDNITSAVHLKRSMDLQLDIGAQFVLIPENGQVLLPAVEVLRDCGIDYLAIKPFVQQENQSYRLSQQLTLEFIGPLLDEAERFRTSTFAVIARRQSFEHYGERAYGHCLGTSFITVVNSAGVVSSCLPHWDDEEFAFGSIYEQSFKELWNSPKRRGVKFRVEESLDVRSCPPNCRPHAVNTYLAQLGSAQVKHRNFI